jgi:uncharacterized protein YdeI (YjbR/CyaY-like superfamily)
MHDGLEVVSFATLAELHDWLVEHHASHPGVWVRLSSARSRRPSITFHDLLEEGLCFGWSESTRHAYDDASYLQRFTPRRAKGTASQRNAQLVTALQEAGRMTPAGYAALRLQDHDTGS